MKAVTIAAVAFVVLSVFVPSKAAADSSVSIKATPQTSFAHGNQRAYIRVIIRVERNPDNRNLIFRWESEDGEIGRKDVQLDGEASPVTFDTGDERFFGKFGFQLPEGHYTISATVERASGKKSEARVEVTIQGGSDGVDR